MGYTHKWVPPYAETPNNLTVWKALCQDIHDQIVASGLDVAADTGQLSISGVGSLPSYGTYAGFKMYKFDDAAQATMPIFIKVEFGVDSDALHGNIGYYSSGSAKTLRIRVTIGTATNGSGTVTGNTIQYSCPHNVTTSSDGTTYNAQASKGFSFICYNTTRGFFGLVYQAGGRDISSSSPGAYGSYSGSSLVILIQRFTDADGTVNDDGFTVVYPYLTQVISQGTWLTGNLAQSKAQSLHSDGTVTNATLQLSRATSHPYQGNISADHPYAYDDLIGVKEVQTLAVARLGAVSAAQEIDLDISTGITQHMISVGRETCMSFYPTKGQEHCMFMLWE